MQSVRSTTTSFRATPATALGSHRCSRILNCSSPAARTSWPGSALFDEQRVYTYLASIELERQVSRNGQIQLSGQSRSIGRVYAGQTVKVQCDAQAREWVVSVADGSVVKRLAICGVDVTTLTGISDTSTVKVPPIQLTLPLAA
jgi:hypothetical protein